MSCFQQLDALKADIWTNNNVQQNRQLLKKMLDVPFTLMSTQYRMSGSTPVISKLDGASQVTKDNLH